MDSSSRSLLDLLNKSSATKKTSDKDQLLALFGQKSSTPAAVESPITSPPSNRNSNANDLLAALMGTSTPKPAQTDASADLLSSLMGSAKSSYSNHAASPARPQNSSVYQSPQQENVQKFSAEDAQASEAPKAPQAKAFFDNSNPFDDLERFQATQAKTEATQRSSSTPLQQVSKRSPSPEQLASKVPKQTSPRQDRARLTNGNTQSQQTSTPGTSEPKNQSQAAASVPGEHQESKDAVSIALPREHSSVLKLTGSKLSAYNLTTSSPVTKMVVKADPVSRSILTMSYRYIAYPLIKEGNAGHIRIVDQDTGETAILSQHSSKVVSLAFSTTKDQDGANALISVDVDSNVIVWSIKFTQNIERIFEIAGPSDTSHKARTSWNTDGTYFGVSITSRLYVFDLRTLLAMPKTGKVKLHPEMKQALCICKAEKAIRGFAFSPDSTTIAGIDKAGQIKFWILESAGRNVSATTTIVLGEKNLSSVHFLGQRHVLLGSQANSALILVDLLAAKAAQELRLPSSDAKDPSIPSMKAIYVAARGWLFVQQAHRKRLYLIQVSLPSAAESKTSTVITNLSTQASHLEAGGHFTTVSEFTSSDESSGDWLDFDGTLDDQGSSLLVAHTKGYTMYTLSYASIEQLLTQIFSIDGSLVTKMQSLGHVVSGEDSSADDGVKNSSAVQEPQTSTPVMPKNTKKNVRLAEQQTSPSLTTEPRTAEMVARIEANLRSSITTELQKNNVTLTTQIEKMQKASNAKHEVVLRLISETLSKNTTQVLQTAINDAVEKTVLPTINRTVSDAVAAHLDKNLPALVESTISGTLAGAVHGAVQKAFESSGLVAQLETAASTMTTDLGTRHKHMEQSLAGALMRLDAQILERQQADSEKIAQLLTAVNALERQVALLKPMKEVPEPARLPQVLPLQTQQAIQAPFSVRQPAPPAPNVEDFTKYHELIMNFVTKSSRIADGDFEGVPFVRQFLSWQPESRVKDDICKSLASDQLQILAFVNALASELTEDDAFNRVHWIGSAFKYLAPKSDSRLATIGPQLMHGVHANLAKTLDRAPPGSQYRHLVENVLHSMPPAL